MHDLSPYLSRIKAMVEGNLSHRRRTVEAWSANMNTIESSLGGFVMLQSY